MNTSSRRSCPMRALWIPVLFVSMLLTPLRVAAGPDPVAMSAAPSEHHDAAATPPEAARLMWWRQDLRAPHIVGDTIYGSFCSDGGSCWLAAVDRVTGADLWIVPIEGEVIGVTAEIIVARHDDRVFGLTIATRREAWSTPADRFGVRAVLSGETLFVTHPEGGVEALDAATGAAEWRATVTNIPVDGRLNGLTVTEGALLLTISEAAYTEVPSSVLALSSQDGAELWRTTDPDGGSFRVLAAERDTAYITTDSGRTLSAVSVHDGATLWSAAPGTGSTFGAAAVAASALIVSETRCIGCENRGSDANATASLIAFAPATGAETWRFATDGTAPSSPMVLGETVYAASNSGELVYAVDTTTGLERWSRPVGSGRVLAATVDMVLVEGDALYALLLG